MPSADNYLESHEKLRVLVYGPAKSRKTTWALSAAEAGFNVLLFDMERGGGIARILSPEARSRIYVLDVADNIDNAFGAKFVASLFTSKKLYLNEGTRQLIVNPRDSFTELDIRSFGSDTVLVLDSYTALVYSSLKEYASENNIDLSEASKTEWDGYGWQGRFLSWFIKNWTSIQNCHTIMIGHATNYEKYKKDPTNPRKQGPLEWTRRQPISSSNPHGMQIAREFTDVLYMYVDNRQTKIDTRGGQYEDAGSRAVKPDLYNWADLSFEKLCQAAGKSVPANPAKNFVLPVYSQQKSQEAQEPAASNPSADSPPTTNIFAGGSAQKSNSLSTLLRK